MKSPKHTLEELLEQRIITGYNVFDKPLEMKGYTFIFSNLHETIAYLEDVEKDLKTLGYKLPLVTRNRNTSFEWKPDYIIRDNDGDIFKNLCIREKKKYLDLNKYKEKTLVQSGLSEEYCQKLIGENKGYEIVLFSESPIFRRKRRDYYFSFLIYG